MAALKGKLDLGLDGRTILVTGAGGGIGRQVALHLAEAGASVFAVDVRSDALEETLALMDGKGHGIATADLSDPEACSNVVAKALRNGGRLDGLVAVHALLIRRDLPDVTPEEFDRQVAVNSKSQFFLCQAALRPMIEAQYGRIVLFTSPSGFIGALARASAYAMTKASSLALARSIARRYGPDNITCNLVSPGSTDTPMLRGDLGDEELDGLRSTIPLRRLADPSEIALGAVYLVSRWGQYVNGHMLTIDGGSSMGG